MPSTFLVQYGLARHVGRFLAGEATFDRGQAVVVRTGRGTEIGRVVAESRDDGPIAAALPPILRAAGTDDLDRTARAAADRHRRFEACRRVFDDGTWPIEPIDLEPLLDDGRAVLHYLGPHGLDVAGLLDAIRDACGLELVFEPVGRDVSEADLVEAAEAAEDHDHGCGSCGSEGGGCGSEGGGCGTSADGKGGGCSGCAVGDLVSRRRATARA